ncbi:MAG TPA: Si-specific NAD(P)(+) transhydrogenase [Candidatus Dormibacteraeota bacterium]
MPAGCGHELARLRVCGEKASAGERRRDAGLTHSPQRSTVRLIETYDVIVIGSGPAGEKAAAHAAYFGRRVAVIEREPWLGGVVVRDGGIPTKTLRETALYVTGFHKRELYGVAPAIDRVRTMEVLRARAAAVAQLVEQQVRANFDRHGVDIVHGQARLTAPGRVTVRATDGGERELASPVVLIATGSRPFHPPVFDFDDPDVLDSESLLTVRSLVGSVAVVGGGPIGCEYASILRALAIEVSLVDVAPRLCSMLDAEISDRLAESFRGLDIDLRLPASVESVRHTDRGLELSLDRGNPLTVDKLLVAAGRAGNTEDLGLDEVGVKLDSRGRVIVGADFQTSCPGVYAAGDVIGPPALASVAMEEGRLAASFALGTRLHEGVRFQPPFGIYGVPEVAAVGMTEQDAAAQGIDYAVGRAEFAGNVRAVIAGAPDGIVKLVFRRDDRCLLGVHVIGEQAAEIIHLGQAVLQNGGGLDYFIQAPFNVPTWTDAYKYAAFDGLQQLEPGAPLRARAHAITSATN